MRQYRLISMALFLATLPVAVRAEQPGAFRSVRVLDENESEPDPRTPQPERGQPPAVQSLPASPQRPGAGVRLEILPKNEFTLGAEMTFRVIAEKPGYVVLVDVDAKGKLAQIYPNMVTLSDPAGVDAKANFLRAGQTVTLPDSQSPFRFVASPPAGVGMVVAILSDTPVQVIDLPDVPTEIAGRVNAAEFIKETTRSLQILPADGSRPTRPPKWAFATGFYGVR
jgi:hypothetical protein